MAEQFIISDSYTIDGKVPREPGVHPLLEFSYRPALSAQRIAFNSFSSNDGEKRARHAGELVKKHVERWSVLDENGKPLDVSVAVAEKLQPTLLSKLVDIILGYAASGEEEKDRGN
jgi:hypothetical protein